MAKKGTEFISERSMTGGLRGVGPAVIRVRRQSKYGRVTYYMNNWLPVPAVLRHLDGVTVRGLALALLAAVGVALVLARVVLGGRYE
jgi:hypothetical protein